MGISCYGFQVELKLFWAVVAAMLGLEAGQGRS